MRCAVEESLNRHIDKVEQQERSLQWFIDSIDDELVELQDMISCLLKRAEHYDGYDFSDELRFVIKDMV